MIFTDTSLKAAEEDYILRWNANAKQHFDDGDYEWICDLINKDLTLHSYHRILEIGCGAGYSTLAFALRDFSIIAIDVNEAAINCTKDLLEEHDYNTRILNSNDDISADMDVCLWKVDLIHEFSRIRAVISEQGAFPLDLVVLCNPGGQLTTDITNQEYKYLLWGGFTTNEILSNYNQGNVGLLHKWAMIYAACGLAQLVEKPILIIERGARMEVQNILQQIQNDIGNRKIYEAYRAIRNAPKDGIKLSVLNSASDEKFWGAGLYYPE